MTTGTTSGPAHVALHRWQYRLCSEWSRFWVAAITQAVLTFGFVLVDPDPARHQVRNLFISWTLYAIVYTAVTLAVFLPADPDELRVRLDRRSRRDTRFRKIFRGGDGPFLAVGMSAAALVFAAGLPLLSGSRQSGTGTTIAAVGAIAGSWTISMVGYALHYAARDTRTPGLTFCGDERPAFADYLYFAISVATTFGTTDTEVTTTRMRRTVSGHTVIAFVFNTVILAIMVSTLLPD